MRTGREGGVPSPAAGGRGTDGSGDPTARRVTHVADRDVLAAARDLRQTQTRPEALLWERLRGRGIAGAKFRRQHPVGRYVLDFYCDAARLAVEIDGACHAERTDLDADRDAWLASQGIRVLRLPASSVLDDLGSAVRRIREALEGPKRP